jgi:hypothetical protein
MTSLQQVYSILDNLIVKIERDLNYNTIQENLNLLGSDGIFSQVSVDNITSNVNNFIKIEDIIINDSDVEASTITTDGIIPKTPDTGILIDDVLIKDDFITGNLIGNIKALDGSTILNIGATSTDTTIIGTLLTSNQPNITSLGNLTGLNMDGDINMINTTIYSDSINEFTLNNGVIIDGVLLKDSGATLNDTNTYFKDINDNTKRFRFNVSNITQGQTRTLTIPDIDDTIVTLDSSGQLTNKSIIMGGDLDMNGYSLTGDVIFDNTLNISDKIKVDLIDEYTIDNGVNIDGVLLKDSGANLQDSTTIFYDNLDNTKKLRFELSGISSETTRTLNIPNVDDTLVTLNASQVLAGKSIIMGGTLNLNGQAIIDGIGNVTIIDDVDIVNSLNINSINEYTLDSGVNIDGVLMKDDGITIQDSTSYIQNAADNTKQLQFNLNNISSNTTRILNIPNVNDTLVTLNANQTLTNKTITMGGNLNMNNQNIVNDDTGNVTVDDNLQVTQTLTVDTINEYTLDSGVNIDGVLMKDNGVTIKDSTTFIQNAADNTKQLQFNLNNISSNTTRILNIPNVNDTLVTLNANQTLTNKTITMGGNLNMNNQNIVNDDTGNVTVDDNLQVTQTLTVDTINEYTLDSGVNIDGVLMKDNGVTIKDSTTFIQNAADNTKQLQFNLNNISEGETRTLTIPNVNDTIVTLDANQTLTNKTITMGGNLNMNNQNIVNDDTGNVTVDDNLQVTQTVIVDTINENTLDNGVNIDGVLIKDDGVTIQDSTSYIQNVSDNTKQLQFNLNNISPSTTRTLTIPNVNDTIVTLDANQTLTNKTITMGGNLDINGNNIINSNGSVIINDSCVVTGNLTVNGTTITVNSSTTLINDNLIVVNSGPDSSRDGGLLIERYQLNNDTGTGDVVNDSPKVSETLPDQTNIDSNQIKLHINASATDDFYNNWWIKITSGSNNNQVRKIIDYDSTTKVAIIDLEWADQNPSIGDTFNLYNRVFVGVFYNELSDNFVFGSTTADPGASPVNIQEYENLEINSLITNIINERDIDSGITIDGVLMKDDGITIKDSTTYIQDDVDNTKQLQFQLSGITGGNTRTLTIPDASGTITLNDATQTLTNKTITMGGNLNMNNQSIVNDIGDVTVDDNLEVTQTLTVNTINEYTTASGITIDGVLIKDGGVILQDSTTYIQDDVDNTKQLQFQLSGITGGNTRTLTIPDASGTITLNDATQTLTNKTITMGGNLNMNNQSIINDIGDVKVDDNLEITQTLSVDTINEYTAASGVTIDGVLLKDNGVTLQDSTTYFQDNDDSTKQLQFQLSGITGGNTRTLTVPDDSGTITLNDATQTLTNKTITMGGNLNMNNQSIVNDIGDVTVDDNLDVNGIVTANQHFIPRQNSFNSDAFGDYYNIPIPRKTATDERYLLLRLNDDTSTGSCLGTFYGKRQDNSVNGKFYMRMNVAITANSTSSSNPLIYYDVDYEGNNAARIVYLTNTTDGLQYIAIDTRNDNNRNTLENAFFSGYTTLDPSTFQWKKATDVSSISSIPVSGNKVFSSNVSVVGTVTADTFTETSDIKLKKNILDIPSQLNNINNIRIVSFSKIDNDNYNTGVIAQEIEQIYPHLVKTNNDIKLVNYIGLNTLAIKAIQELTEKVLNIENENKRLNDIIDNLIFEIQELKNLHQ